MEKLFTWITIFLLELLQILSTLNFANGANKIDGSQQLHITDTDYYEVTVATFYHKRRRRETTLDKGQHLDDLILVFQAFQKNFTVDLKLYKDLISRNYIEKDIAYSQHNIHRPSNLISKHCFYHGSVQGLPHSMAAVSTCDNGVSGFVQVDGVTYHLEPADEVIPGSMKVFQDTTNNIGSGSIITCDSNDRHSMFYTNGTVNNLHRKEILQRSKRSLRGPYDSNENSRFVELYLVNDYRTFDRQGRNKDRLIRRSQDIANIVSRLYRPLNIYIALVGVEIWTTSDQFTISTYANQSLENFLHYRKQRINPYHRNDNAQLITGQTFNDGVVGKAIKSSICTHQFSGGVDMDRDRITHVATTVAHELGHNFGMDHDNYSYCRCTQEKCIMAPTSGGTPSPSEWSSCSRVAVIDSFELGMDYCLTNRPKSLFKGPVCGNAFVEDGEECDCGLPEDCTSKCCNASTCRLLGSALCATGHCCDQTTCKPKPAATLCRPAMEECDLAEFCNGDSEYCPDDIHLQDGNKCQNGKSYCYNGSCTTHTDQCKKLWGSTGRVSDPICFGHLNTNGSKHGNCGYNWQTDQYKRCDKDDVMCGLLHCVHLNEKLMFWRETLAKATPATFLTKGRDKYVCRSVILDVGLDMPDPGMVPDGAKCGDRKICINHTCQPFSMLYIPKCPDCHGNGVCNSKGQCHCKEGFAPPLCNAPGHGGSIHSGPMKISEDNSVLIGMLVFFALFVLSCSLAFLLYYHRTAITKWWNRQSANLKYSVPCLPLKKPSRGPPPSGPPPRAPPPQITTPSSNTNITVPPPRTPVPKQSHAKLKNGSVSMEISDPVLQESTNKQRLKENISAGQPKPSPLFSRFMSSKSSETPPPPTATDSPKPVKPSPFSKLVSKSNDTGKSSPKPSPKPVPKPPPKPSSTSSFQPSDPIVKKDSFNREISQPVLISTTDRRSKAFVKENSFENKDDLQNTGSVNTPPPVPPHAPVKRQHSDRAHKGPPRPTSLPPQPIKDRLKNEDQQQKINRKSVADPGAKSPPRPPPPVISSQSHQPQPSSRGQGQRLNLNPNMRMSSQGNNIRESAFEEETPAPRVFFDKSKYKIENDTPPPISRRKTDRPSSSEVKAGKLPSTNATKTSFDLKGKNPTASFSKKPVTSSKPLSQSKFSETKPLISKPLESRSSTKSNNSRSSMPSSDILKNQKMTTKTPSVSSSGKQNSVDSAADEDNSQSAGVAAITAMFDNMDIGTSIFSAEDSPPQGSPVTKSSRVHRNNAGAGDRPKPASKPGSGHSSRVRSVNV